MSDHRSTDDHTPESPRDLSPSEVYALLADDRRRATIAVLADASPPVDFETVADRVHARLGHDPDRRSRVTIALRHDHLPKLDGAGLVVYDASSNVVVAVAEDLAALPVEDVTDFER
ncbi:MAG: hypothetical protein ABEJ70_05085 [Halobacteriaceae archaeon]